MILRTFRSALLSIFRDSDKWNPKHVWWMELQWYETCWPSWIMGNLHTAKFIQFFLRSNGFLWELIVSYHQLSSTVRYFAWGGQFGPGSAASSVILRGHTFSEVFGIRHMDEWTPPGSDFVPPSFLEDSEPPHMPFSGPATIFLNSCVVLVPLGICKSFGLRRWERVAGIKWALQLRYRSWAGLWSFHSGFRDLCSGDPICVVFLFLLWSDTCPDGRLKGQWLSWRAWNKFSWHMLSLMGLPSSYRQDERPSHHVWGIPTSSIGDIQSSWGTWARTVQNSYRKARDRIV